MISLFEKYSIFPAVAFYRPKTIFIQAVETLRRLRVEAMGGNETTFANLASQWSDCNSSKRGGDLGSFGRGKMQPPFEDVAFELPVGRVSDVVLTNSGAHIIYRVS